MLLQRLFDRGVNNATVSKEGFLFAKRSTFSEPIIVIKHRERVADTLIRN